jgi:hypothetical protein
MFLTEFDNMFEKSLNGIGGGYAPITNTVSNHPGMEMLPIDIIKQYSNSMEDRRLYNKSSLDMGEPTQSLLPRLTAGLKDGSLKITEPLELSYDPEEKIAMLTDGNTRLVAIEDAGFTHAPVILNIRKLHGFGIPVKWGVPENIYSQWIKPSEIFNINESIFTHGSEKKLINLKTTSFLGKGADQKVYLDHNTGHVIKLFGTGSNNKPHHLTEAQKSFITFALYCKSNPTNPFLPKILECKKAIFKNNTYLIIKTEQLLDLKKNELQEWGYGLEDVVDLARLGPYDSTLITRQIQNRGNEYIRISCLEELIIHLGINNFKLLWNTLHALELIAKENSWYLDLHYHNFMIRANGEFVINDPFYVIEENNTDTSLTTLQKSINEAPLFNKGVENGNV